MSKQMSFALAIASLLMAAAMRLVGLASIPPGLSVPEAYDVQIAELIRFGQVEVIYSLPTGGREGLYHILLSTFTAFVGNSSFGYRLLSVWFGLLAMSLLYTLTRRLYGRTTGLLAMIAFTVPMWSILLSRTVARESMLPLMVTAVLLAFARALPVYRRPNLNPSTIPFAMLGLLLGLGFYVHPAHYFIVLGSMVFIAYMILTRQPMSRRTLSYLSFSIVILIIVATPYLITVFRRPELGGATRLGNVFNLVSDIGIFLTVSRSFAGLFFQGDLNILVNLPGRSYIDPLSGILIIWGIIIGVRRFQEPRYALPVITLAVLLPIALFAPNSPNFMAYVVLMPLLAILFAIGVKGLLKHFRAQSRWVVGGVTALLAANLIWSVQGVARWMLREDVQTAYHARTYAIAQYLDKTVSETQTVVCVPQVPTHPTWLASPSNDATLLALMMDNPDESNIRYLDCGSGMVFTRGGDHQQLIVLAPPPAINEFHPYIQDWVAQGDLILDDVPVQSVVSMIVSEQLGQTVGRFTTTAPAGYAPESPGGVAPVILPVGFEGNLTFLGYEMPDIDKTYRPGDIVTLITYWRVDSPLSHDLNLFAHVLFDSETIVTQTDTISLQPQRLQARDVFIQVTFIPLPPDIPEGAYQISVGAYDPGEDARFAVLYQGMPRGDRLFLSEVQVIPPQTASTQGG